MSHRAANEVNGAFFCPEVPLEREDIMPEDEDPEEGQMDRSNGLLPGTQAVMLERLSLDDKLQLRSAMLPERVEDFCQAMREGAVFPPVVAFWDGAALWLGDGYHRVAAARQADLLTLSVEVREGTWRDALAFAFFANATQGEPLRPRERRESLPRIIEQFPDESTRELAARLGISNGRVSQVRQQLAGVQYLTPDDTDVPPVVIGRDGKRYPAQRPPPSPPLDLEEEPSALPFEIPPFPVAPPEESAFYALGRQCLTTKLSPDRVAAISDCPEQDLSRFRKLAAWLSEFVQCLEQRASRPLRAVE